MKKFPSLLVIILALHLFLLLKLKFTAWPEMLLWPYLIVHGLLPYRDIAIAHTPNLLIILSLIYKVFGVGVFQLKIYTWAVIIFTDFLLFWVINKLSNKNSLLFNSKKVAIIAVSLFVFWQVFYDGNGLWFDSMIAPISLFVFFLIHKKKYLWAGVLWVIMFFTKQTAIWFLIPIIFSLKKYRDFIYGGTVTVIIYFLATLFWGNLPNFYEWAIKFGVFVLPRSQGQIQFPDLKNMLIALFPFSIFIPYFIKMKSKVANLPLWALAGSMTAYPRFEFFHFQPGLPFLAMSSAIVLTNLNKRDRFLKMFIALYALVSIYLFTNFFIRNWQEGTRFFESDVSDVANYVKNNTTPGDKIFVMNWWDNVYALTNTLPATNPWVPQLYWYQEIQGVQDREVADLIASKPRLILLQDYSESGLASYKPQKVYDYVILNYKLKEKIDGIEILIPKK
ncbi:MAG TPA: hypothetical protein VKC53_01400 [Patescibacteria group bacterium]|nr:hypothetical protein [Patescibacteria group bacterium]